MVEPAKPEPEDKTKALAKVETSVCGLVLHTLDDMKTVAQLILQSNFAPESFKTSEQIFVGLQTGAEIGLKPMQALNSIVVIKGRPTLWGDAALALVKRSSLNEYCKEYFELDGAKTSEKDIQYAKHEDYPDELMAVCETKRKGEDEPVKRYFSVADAKLAKLWTKTGPWTTHPKRMLKYKARAFNLRDNFPDVLFGMHLTEEMYGEESLPAPESDVPPRDERRKLAVPSSTVDTRRAKVPVTEPIPGAMPGAKKMLLEDSKDKLTPESIDRIEVAADGDVVPVEDKEEKPEPESKLVTFQCPKCLRTYQYGKEEGKGVQCECGKGVLEEQEKHLPDPDAAELANVPSTKELYVEVNGMYVVQGGKNFFEFAAYVLCLDENEISPGKLTVEQLKQIKAYIETSGITIA